MCTAGKCLVLASQQPLQRCGQLLSGPTREVILLQAEKTQLPSLSSQGLCSPLRSPTCVGNLILNSLNFTGVFPIVGTPNKTQVSGSGFTQDKKRIITSPTLCTTLWAYSYSLGCHCPLLIPEHTTSHKTIPQDAGLSLQSSVPLLHSASL